MINDKFFKCLGCNTEFTEDSEFFNHIRFINAYKSNDKQVKCTVCEAVLANEFHLFNHLRKHSSSDSQYQCRYCGDTCFDKTTFDQHIDLHRSRDFKCKLCERSFDDPHKLFLHKTRGKICIFKCSFCDKKYLKKNSLTCHERSHTGEKRFQCRKCDRRFVTKISLSNHINMEVPCSKISEQNRLAKAGDIQSSSKIRSIIRKCSQCGESFPSRQSSSCVSCRQFCDNENFQCSFCGKQFISKLDLIEHVYLHTGQKPYMCSFCNQKFSQKDSLNEHLKFVHKCKVSICSQCDQAFATKSALNIHMRQHKDQSLYKCNQCSKLFVQEHLLNSHLRTHIDQNNYRCPICRKKFQSKRSLSLHMSIKNCRKSHECPFCSKSFKEKEILVAHLRIHTNDRPFQCLKCSKTFRRKCYWQKHLKSRCKPDKYVLSDAKNTRFNVWISADDNSNVIEKSSEGAIQREQSSIFSVGLSADANKKKTPSNSPSSLKDNLLIPIDETLYECLKCNKIINKQSMTTHLRSFKHTGIKRFKCSLCGKLYAEASGMQYHFLHHHNLTKTECEREMNLSIN